MVGSTLPFNVSRTSPGFPFHCLFLKIYYFASQAHFLIFIAFALELFSSPLLIISPNHCFPYLEVVIFSSKHVPPSTLCVSFHALPTTSFLPPNTLYNLLTHLLHNASLDSSVNEAFLQRQCIMKWDKCGGSRVTHYTTHVVPNYKTIFFTERGNHTHRYMLKPILLSVIRTIASMRRNSHTL